MVTRRGGERGVERGTIALGAGHEFDAIRRMLARWGPLATAIGDDAAVITPPPGARVVVSTDAAIEDVHFRREWFTPREIGYRAAAAALSDLAAMAAEPLGLLLSLGLPPSWERDLEALADGVADAARLTSAPILGGNLSVARELSITTTVLGAARAPVGRAGARPGDTVYLTGRLGGPGRALSALARGEVPDVAARERLASPVPRLAEARWLADHGARALIDVSDGLVADLGHLAAASGVRVELRLEAVLCVAGVAPLDAAASGEEYELLAALPAAVDPIEFWRACGLELAAIAAVVEGAPGVEVTFDGRRVAPAGGHDHLSR